MYEVMPLALFVDRLKSAAELTRLRILLLLSRGDLTVSDITGILGQSQPRVSRHMKLLQEAGLISRHQEGAWALFRLSDSGSAGELVRDLCARIDLSDPVVERDLARLAAVKAERQRRAADYFSRSAARWDELRKLHVDEATVEAAVRSLVGDKPVHALLDIGTGTGRMLEMLAPLYRHGIGIDTNRDMLNVARANLDRAGIGHAHVSYGDAFSLPVGRDEYDLVIIHQVLHYLDEPDAVIGEAARALRPGGRLLIVDFAPHDLEFLRTEHAHQRLGFSTAAISGWARDCGLEFVTARELAPAGGENRLAVTLWLARDPRILIADTPAPPIMETA